MKSPRRRAREFALQALYQWQLTKTSFADMAKQYAEADGFEKTDGDLFRAILQGSIDGIDELSAALSPYLDRPWVEVSPIERAVLLIAAFEMSRMPETPYRVIINEAIELAKSFGGTDGHKYVNGVLDKLAAIVRSDEIADQATNPRPTAKTRVKKEVAITTKTTRKLAS